MLQPASGVIIGVDTVSRITQLKLVYSYGEGHQYAGMINTLDVSDLISD